MKRFLVVLIASVMFVTFVGFAIAEETEFDMSTLKVGISSHAYNSASSIRQTDFMTYAFQESGCETVTLAANGSVEQQLTDIESLLEQNVDIILMIPCQTDGYDVALQACKEAEVPVILVQNSLSDAYKVGEDYLTLMQTNMVEEGYLVGKLISEIAETKLDGQARTLEIFATPGTSAVNDRNNGFSNAVRDFGNISLVATQTTYSQVAESQSTVENYIMSTGEPTDEGINTIAAMTHNCAVGAIAAIYNMGYTPNEDIYVVAIDGVLEDIELILSGELYACVEHPVYYGFQLVDIVREYYTTGSVEEFYDCPCNVFTAENAQEYYDLYSHSDELINYTA